MFGLAEPPDQTAPNTPVRRQFGKGRVVYIPRLEAQTAPPPAQMTSSVENALWKLPKNYDELVSAIRWAAKGHFSAEIEAPLWVTAEVADQESSRTRLLHLVNFKFSDPITDIHVRVQIPQGLRLQEAVLKSPDFAGPRRLQVSVDRGVASVSVPQLNAYDLVLFRMQVQ